MIQIQSEKDFLEIRKQFQIWKKRFPMFEHDVRLIEESIEKHITNFSKLSVSYRQTHKNKFLEDAQKELDSINRILSTVNKLELIAVLSR